MAVQNDAIESPITVLSIDGGGIRAVIPAKILAALEKMLQEKEQDNKVRVVDYFDMLAGTSAGAIITAMLASPEIRTDEKGSRDIVPDHRPLPATSIVEFFEKKGPEIFPGDKSDPEKQDNSWKKLKNAILRASKTYKSSTKAIVNFICKATFPRHTIDQVAEEMFMDLTLDDTLKEVIIPAYRVDKLGPYIFSTHRAKLHLEQCKEKIKIKDVVLSSSAAPVKFDPYNFEMTTDQHQHKEHRRFADGGLAANNPVIYMNFASLSDAKNLFKKPLDSKNYMVLSLGCGTTQKPDMPEKQTWHKFFRGLFFWFQIVRDVPLIIDVLLDSNSDMVDTYMAQIFHDEHKNYLRIQEYELDPNLYTMIETNKIRALATKADELLGKHVSRLNTMTGLIETQNEGPTYTDLLSDFADVLIKQRHLKLKLHQQGGI